jgi:diaminohydroxyphosphoribosylaminopyrimidine deaminase / 5-amino-6-(5-phosphoribosylamino)uracil reductase
MSPKPSAFMERALELARQAQGTTSPNPWVGAVVVRDGRIVGEGYTLPPGGAHAEVVALEQAGDAARGATVYATLEPCAHHGRTPPCTDALIAAGVTCLVYSITDPDEKVSGRGRAALEAAGVAFEEGDGADEASRLLEAYIKHRRTGLPFVVVKYAATMDGRIAAGSGDSRWVSGPETLRWAHEERTRLDAIMVGASTIVIDDSQLTARPGGIESDHQPLRVVVDSRGRVSEKAKVLPGKAPGQASARAKTIVATTDRSSKEWRASMEATGAEVVVLPAGEDGRVPLEPLLQELGRRGVLLLLSEGGGVLHGSLFDQRLVDKVTAVIAPMIVGAKDAPAAVSGRGARSMREAVRLNELSVARLGDDILITGYPVYAD